MRVGWFADDPGFLGGAELTEAGLRRAAPDDVVFTTWDDPSADVVVVHNCTQLPADARPLAPLVKVVHDTWTTGDETFRTWALGEAAMLLFSSPLHHERFPFEHRAPWMLWSPALDLQPFRDAPKTRESDVLWLANNFAQKGWGRVTAWITENRTGVAAYGSWTVNGAVAYQDVPALMGRFRRFLFLPGGLEPFGRTVAEAWAAGLDLVLEESEVGAVWWIENRPEDIERGAEMFWEAVSRVSR